MALAILRIPHRIPAPWRNTLAKRVRGVGQGPLGATGPLEASGPLGRRKRATRAVGLFALVLSCAPALAQTLTLSVQDDAPTEEAHVVVTEGTDSHIVFTVELSAAAPAGGLTVQYFTKNGAAGRNGSTAAQDAVKTLFLNDDTGDVRNGDGVGIPDDGVASQDFVGVRENSPSTLSIAATQTTGLISLTLKDDTTHETDEYFNLVLLNPSSGVGFAGAATQLTVVATIEEDDNDPLPTMSIGTWRDHGSADNMAFEGDTLLFTVRWDRPTSIQRKVNIKLVPNTAQPNEDYGRIVGLRPQASECSVGVSPCTRAPGRDAFYSDFSGASGLVLSGTPGFDDENDPLPPGEGLPISPPHAQELIINGHHLELQYFPLENQALFLAVDILRNDLYEGTNETFTIRLTDPVNTQIDNAQASIEITIGPDRTGMAPTPNGVTISQPADGSHPDPLTYVLRYLGVGDTAPRSEVTVKPSVPDGAGFVLETADPANDLVFHPAQYQTPQTITIRRVEPIAPNTTATVIHRVTNFDEVGIPGSAMEIVFQGGPDVTAMQPGVGPQSCPVPNPTN